MRRGAGQGRAPLEGLRIIDMTHQWAGPLCTRLLADMGAQVIKIEAPRRVDGVRYAVLPRGYQGSEPWNNGAAFQKFNRNKQSLTLDLGAPEGRRAFLRLVLTVDALVTNFSPRVMRNLEIEYQRLRRARPDIIVLAISGFGATGPYRDWSAFGTSLEPMAGLASLTGYEDGPPMRLGVAIPDPIGALHGAAALAAALLHRRATGEGQLIDLSLRESAMRLVAWPLLDYQMNGRTAERMGNAHARMAPHGCYRCKGKDAWVTLAVRSDEEWARLRQLLPPLDRGQFATTKERLRHRRELDQVVEAWTSHRTAAAVTAALQSLRIPASPVNNSKALFGDPHYLARGFFVEIATPGQGRRHYPGLPYKMLDLKGSLPMQPAPRLGRDNARVLGGLLGMRAGELGLLRRRNVIGTRPLGQ